MQRLPDWSLRLERLVRERLLMPFCWGLNDCALYAADSVLACTGMDPAHDLRGTYCTALQAARVMRRHGGLAGLAASRLGEQVPAAMAQRGDVGISPQRDGAALLVVCNGTSWLAPSRFGLATAAQPAMAWRAARCLS